MNQGTSKKTIVFEVVALAALVLFFGVSVWRGGYSGADTALSEPEFTPPVYEMGFSGADITTPLFLPVGTDGYVVRDVREEELIAMFKQMVLSRVASEKSLGEREKSVLRVSLSVESPQIQGGVAIANQSVLHFSPDEVAMLETALQQQ